MSVVVVALFAVVVGASASPTTEIGGGDPVFTRVEPHIAAGVRALEAEDPDLALERFRRAETTTDEQRAIVEYNAGQALLFQAMKKAEADAAAQPAPQQPTTTPQPGQPGQPAAQQPTPPDVVDALAAFERAASLGKNPAFISEARLAAGNAALVGSKLDDAIAQLRKALVASPGNERARRNLQRALQLKQQQPPQQQDGGGDGDSDENKEGDEKKDGEEKKDGQQQGEKDDSGEQEKQGDKGDKNDEQKPEDDKDGDGKKDEPEPKDGEDKASEKDGDGKEGDDGKDGETPAPTPAPKKPTSKEEARRLLEGIRSRERPLSPIEMRGTERRPAENGKDW